MGQRTTLIVVAICVVIGIFGLLSSERENAPTTGGSVTTVSPVAVSKDIDEWKWIFDVLFIGNFLVENPPFGAKLTWHFQLYEEGSDIPTVEWTNVQFASDDIGLKLAVKKGASSADSKETGLVYDIRSQTYNKASASFGYGSIPAFLHNITQVIEEPLALPQLGKEYVVAFWAASADKYFRSINLDLDAGIEAADLVERLHAKEYGTVRVLTLQVETAQQKQ